MKQYIIPPLGTSEHMTSVPLKTGAVDTHTYPLFTLVLMDNQIVLQNLVPF